MFQVGVPKDVIVQVESRWAPPNHPVFKLVSSDFSDRAFDCWKTIGSPPVDLENVWDTFTQMVDKFHGIGLNPAQDLRLHSGNEETEDNEPIELLPGLQHANIHAGLSRPLPCYTLQFEQGAPTDGEEDSDEESICSDIGGGLFVDL